LRLINHHLTLKIIMPSQTVHLFVFDTLSDWEPCHAIVGINNTTFQKTPGRFAVKTVGLTKSPVKTMGGLTILPDMELAELDPSQSAMLILPGGESWDAGKNLEAIEKALAFLAAGMPVAAICGATGALARAGALDEKHHTSNALEYLQATGYHGASKYMNQPAVIDGCLITASGTAPLEFAYQILKLLDVFSPDVLEAWFGLFKTGEMQYYGKLMEAMKSMHQS
jgi:putative intracellular protease/amidase